MNKLKRIENRNKRVELDKAWEISWTRKLTIAIMTYLIALIFLISINIEQAWLSAFVPTGGYILSTLSLYPLKNFWLRSQKNRKQ